MTQPDASLMPKTPEAQQETIVAESWTGARTTGSGAPPPRNLGSDGIYDEDDGGDPDDDEVSFVTQAHKLANGRLFLTPCFVLSTQQTR